MKRIKLLGVIITAMFIFLACTPAATPVTPAPSPTTAPSSPTVPTTVPSSPTADPASSTTFPITVTDDAGRQVTITQAPQRIISLAATHTETLYALGLGDRIVAVDDFSDYPPEAKSKPQIDGWQPNIEQIVSLQPDLVLVLTQGPDFLGQMEARQIPALELDPVSVEAALERINVIGKIMDRSVEASKLVDDLRQGIDAITTKTQNVQKPRVFYELDATDPTKPYTPGPGSYLDEMIRMAGGTNVAASAKSAWAQFSVEEIVNADPEIILLGDALVPTNPQTPEMVKQRNGWGNISAVKNGRIVPVNDVILSRPGPRIVEGLEELARAIHPELFP